MATEQSKPRRSGGRVDLAAFAGQITGANGATPAPPATAPTAPPPAPPQRDPDPAPPQAAEPEPQAAPAPADTPRRQQAPRRTRERASQPPPSQDVDLSRVLGSQPVNADDQPPRSLALQEILQMRRKRVDPMNDFGPDGTRMVVWIQDAIKLVSDLTGYKQQEVVRDALLGIRPLPPEVLDETFAARYGYPRPRDTR